MLRADRPEAQREFFLRRALYAGTEANGRRFGTGRGQAPVPVPWVSEMSAILPISFVVTLLCVLLAIHWPLYQQILFLGAALSATVWVCSLEAWSTSRGAPASEDEQGRGHRADE
jgi:hypothetical protein